MLRNYISNKTLIFSIIIIVITIILLYFYVKNENHVATSLQLNESIKVKLPSPMSQNNISVASALQKRRSIRTFKKEPLTMEDIAQLLWAAQGITSDNGFRTAPSAGALYPLQAYLISGDVKNLTSGIYQYLPANHTILPIVIGDQRHKLTTAALNQNAIENAPISIVITAIYEKTTTKYGKRGIRFAQMEAGHVAQNILLQAVSLGLGAVTIGSFDDLAVVAILKVHKNESPLYIIPIGRVH